MYFQELCIEKAQWDSPLTEAHKARYMKLISETEHLNEIQVKRALSSSKGHPVSQVVHGFSDLSSRAFSAVAYLRTAYKDCRLTVTFIAAKSKVTPLVKQSIPHLELNTAVLLTQLVNSIRNHLPFLTTSCLWTDSMTALAWITTYRPWKLYIRNRVETIRRLSDVNSWRHCPGEINPADLPTRGVCAKELVNNQLWWEGPGFLKEDLEQLPKIDTKIDESILKEAVINSFDVTHSLVSKLKVENVAEFDHFSSKQKLLRVVAYLLHFLTNLKGLIFSDSMAYEGESKPSEYQSAENIIIKQIQAQNFQEEIRYLQGNRSSTIPAYIQTFNLFFDDNRLLQCRTRLQNVQLNAVEKNPILIPTHTSYADLIIKESRH